MTMSKCPKCKTTLCDPQLYFKAQDEIRCGLKMLIDCPVCKYQAPLKEFVLENHREIE